MEANYDDFPMTPFDQNTSSESLQILKAAIPYAPPPMQRALGIYAYMTQLKTLMSGFSGNGAVSMMSHHEAGSSFPDMFQEICQYAGSRKESLENLSSIFSALQLFQMYQSTGQEESEAFDES